MGNDVHMHIIHLHLYFIIFSIDTKHKNLIDLPIN